MKGLSKREAIKGVRSFLKGSEKKQFSAQSRPPRSLRSSSSAQVVRFANGVQLTLTSKNKV